MESHDIEESARRHHLILHPTQLRRSRRKAPGAGRQHGRSAVFPRATQVAIIQRDGEGISRIRERRKSLCNPRYRLKRITETLLNLRQDLQQSRVLRSKSNRTKLTSKTVRPRNKVHSWHQRRRVSSQTVTNPVAQKLRFPSLVRSQVWTEKTPP